MPTEYAICEWDDHKPDDRRILPYKYKTEKGAQRKADALTLEAHFGREHWTIHYEVYKREM